MIGVQMAAPSRCIGIDIGSLDVGLARPPAEALQSFVSTAHWLCGTHASRGSDL
jgi:hypothetical protein